MEEYPPYALRFLGTAGARFTVMHQIRASGGLWVGMGEASWVVDPGPGALVRLCEASPSLDPTRIDALLLTHRHIDHSTDMNILAEAMTGGGSNRRGVVVLPEDALHGAEPILYRYLHDKVERIETWRPNQVVALPGNATAEPVPLCHHGVECMGLIFRHPSIPTWGIVSDTRFLEELPRRFADCRTLILNVTLRSTRPTIDHLSLDDIPAFLDHASPRLLLLTHMGRGLLESDPQLEVDRFSTPTTQVIAARDGMIVDLVRGCVASSHPTSSK